MNEDSLSQRLQETRDLVSRHCAWVSEESWGGFAAGLGALKGWETFRINPIRFAGTRSLDEDAVVCLFVYGSKAGLFRFEWNLVCPYCGGREHSHKNLNQLEKDVYHCTLCDLDADVDADRHLEVSFTLPQDISGFHPDPFASMEDYSSYHFSGHLKFEPEFAAAMARQPPRRFVTLAPGEKETLACPRVPSGKYRCVSFETHSICNLVLPKDPQEGEQTVEVVHNDEGFEAARYEATGENVSIELINRGSFRVGFFITGADTEELVSVYDQHPSTLSPFVTGKMMLNNQCFRELYLVDSLPDDLSLRVCDLTLMFTDLKGSTALYDRTGDIAAYRLVQSHFGILSRIVQAQQGAIIKTMGDAIMASFNSPQAGIAAALDMLSELAKWRHSSDGLMGQVGLKIGLHRGPVIAVKANQTLDYFGQTVNIAARVQGLADAGEIWLTQEMIRDEALVKPLKSRGLTLANHTVSLKGVGSQVRVYQCRPA